MGLAADSNTATRAADLAATIGQVAPGTADEPVEQALAAAVQDADRIGDLLDVLRSARLWLPLPADGRPAITGDAVTLPTVSYLGTEFVPAYSSARLLEQFARAAAPPDSSSAAQPAGAHPAGWSASGPSVDQAPAAVPHVVVRAADLARLLPPAIGIALNAGAAHSLPLYPPGVSYLAAAAGADPDDAGRISVAPLAIRPDALLAGIAAGLIGIAAVREAVAAWLSVELAGEGLLVAVSLDDPADAANRDLVVGAVERAAWEVKPDEAAFPIDVTFPGERTPDRIDEQIAAVGTPFYRRG
ncbi:MAG TPA: SseB family protein [Streptosporangiaceae bacterium]|nr:SseB family protein [Streptosporangiaceae bacterium]